MPGCAVSGFLRKQSRTRNPVTADPRESVRYKGFNTSTFTDPDGELAPNGVRAMFSPRKVGLLEWIADQMGKATSNVMFTTAFGVTEQLVREFEKDKDFVRFILMERRDKDDQARLETDPDTRIALARERRGDPRRAAILDPTDRWVARHFRLGTYHGRKRVLFR
ncbi:MAG: hypothetical protein GY703_22670 [Gammaproteobacteria bacterium]|nr:hypothetical protein [Gammaproteobacteria bacterium]